MPKPKSTSKPAQTSIASLPPFDLGHAAVHPADPLVAGEFVTLRFTYTCGHPIDDSGYVKIVFRSTSDVGAPQFDAPGAPNFCTVTTTGNCRIEPRWDAKGHVRPWSRALFLKITSGYLDRGEQISVTFGDTSHGSPGWQMQTNVIEDFEFKTLVDPIATYLFKELPDSPVLPIVPGAPVRALCIAPSQAVVGEPFTYFLKLEDRWGNPTGLPQALTHPGFPAEGVQTVVAEDEATGLRAESNPIAVTTHPPALNRYWADFHGQTGETVGMRTVEDYFVFARDYGLLDISAHSSNDFQVTDDFWEKINRTTAAFYRPGEFVTFPGYEWSGNTPLGGDRNVYFEVEGGDITRSSNELLPDNRSKYGVSPTAAHLFQNLAAKPEQKPFVFAHVGGRYADLAMHDPDLELSVEVHSAWGTFEWLLADAFSRGYRVGIGANSDGHKCRPGASYPGAGKFGSLGGLTCVLSPRLDRDGVVQALRARHFYATTGNRPLVDLKVVADGKAWIMGDIEDFPSGTATLHVSLTGTVPIDNVEVRNGMQVIARLRPYPESALGRRVKIVWAGAAVRGRNRLVNWRGDLTVQGNAIVEATPLNFWNANTPLVQTDSRHLAWQSVTTGGTAGLILTLQDEETGVIQIRTEQGNQDLDVAAIGMEPTVWRFGGLGKALRVYRLPDHRPTNHFSFSLPLADLHPGDNPIYIRMVQEDEHMAWTSPVYLVQ